MRVSRTLLNTTAAAIKRHATTGITGLKADPNPRPSLLQAYDATLEALSGMPEESVYRRATEALTRQRKSVVEKTEDLSQIEQQIEAGLVEEILKQAQDELSLAQKMLVWRAWEELEDPAPAGQWDTPLERK
ncbi:hypothetical protein PYCC9005_000723 [Savitreella phatthalungensis]